MSFLKKLFADQQKPEAYISLIKSHKQKIYPWVKAVFYGDDDPRNTAVQIKVSDDEELVFKNWLADLAIFYVADMGNNFQLISKKDISGICSEDELHQIAVENLLRDIEFKLHENNFGGYGLIAGGDHESGSICLLEKWEWLADHFNDNLIVAIPAKDMVMMVAESDTDKVNNLKIFVHEIFKDGERLLTKNIFKFDKETSTWLVVDRII